MSCVCDLLQHKDVKKVSKSKAPGVKSEETRHNFPGSSSSSVTWVTWDALNSSSL